MVKRRFVWGSREDIIDKTFGNEPQPKTLSGKVQHEMDWIKRKLKENGRLE